MILAFQGLLLGLSAAASPGPFQAFLLARALRDGWRKTWKVAFAPLISDGPVVLSVLLLLSSLPGWFLHGLRLGGGLFLLYLAWGVFAALRRTGKASRAVTPVPGGQTIRQAALVNILSPGPWLFWSTVGGPAFLQGWRLAPTQGLVFLVGFYTAMVGICLALIALFSGAGRLDSRFVLGLNIISGLVLVGYGGYQVGAGFEGLFL
jgi:threonine/homoserine/homoserine lactone efflux protein